VTKEEAVAKRVVLAYSGGLDTSVAVRWLREEWGVEVVACAVDVGQQHQPGPRPPRQELARRRQADDPAADHDQVALRRRWLGS